MAGLDKKKIRIAKIPSDYAWSELISLLGQLGYTKIEGNGSRVKFFHSENDSLINLHKPHPGSIVKQYMVRQIVAKLKEAGFTL